ncbi:MAG: YkgJ family cysteine cluster protein [Halomonadaceae bacterium]|nr:MAG: YkgJ family cysteine cluster protein [Halomonadaceae bacterium]
MDPIPVTELPDPSISCSRCSACCCRLEVILISDTGVPPRFITETPGGSHVMERLDDGWCAALDRNTMLCSIYEQRPWVCREFEMGSYECLVERQENGE